MRIALICQEKFTVKVENFTLRLCALAHSDESLCRLSGLLEIAKASTSLLLVFLLRILQFLLQYCLEGQEAAACFPVGA